MRSTTIHTTAANLRAILCYISVFDYEHNPAAQKLYEKIKEAVGDVTGIISVSITFNFEHDKEEQVYHEFKDSCKNIAKAFTILARE